MSAARFGSVSSTSTLISPSFLPTEMRVFCSSSFLASKRYFDSYTCCSLN